MHNSINTYTYGVQQDMFSLVPVHNTMHASGGATPCLAVVEGLLDVLCWEGGPCFAADGGLLVLGVVEEVGGPCFAAGAAAGGLLVMGVVEEVEHETHPMLLLLLLMSLLLLVLLLLLLMSFLLMVYLLLLRRCH